MTNRNLAALAALLAATALERFGYLGSRAFLHVELRDAGGTAAAAGTMLALIQALMVLGLLVGGALALAIGPRATTAIGALLAAAGHLAPALGASIPAGACLVALGAGVFRPGLYVAVAEALAWDDEGPAAPGAFRIAAVAAFVLALQGIAHVAGGIAAPITGVLHDRGPGLARVLHVATAVLAAGFAGGAAVLFARGSRARSHNAAAPGPYREARAATRPRAASPALALGGLAVLLVPQTIANAALAETGPHPSAMSALGGMWIYSVQPIAGFVATIAVFIVLFSAAARRSSRPPLQLHGVGLLVSSSGLAPIALAGSSSMALYALGAVVTAFGEAAVIAVPLAYAAVAVRGRAASLVVAVWLAASAVARSVGILLHGWDSARSALLWAGAVLGVAAGAALLAYGRALHNACFEPPMGEARS